MSVIIKKTEAGRFVVVSGALRLKVNLDVSGQCRAVEISTGEELLVFRDGTGLVLKESNESEPIGILALGFPQA